MKALLGSWLILGLVATLPSQELRSAAKIQVFVYNYAGLPAGTLLQAEQEAARIYHLTGIETEWLDCPLSPEQADLYPACRLPVSPTRLAVGILSRPMAERIKLSRKTFGVAFIPEDGGFARVAQICGHCAEELAAGLTVTPGLMLGHLMAHELGHLLLGQGSHGASGLMHVPWHKKELQKVSQGTLMFMSWEGDKMRAQILQRTASEQTSRPVLPAR
jgi:hypothetical protein